VDVQEIPGVEVMTKEQLLELIKLLSAVESWSFSAKSELPEYLYDKIDLVMKELSAEVLK
jgi:hypothetical protein